MNEHGYSYIFKKAKWIWISDNTRTYNQYAQLKKEFFIEMAEYDCIMRIGFADFNITADAMYQLWVNGRIVGHGPAKSAEGYRSVDTYNIVPYLQPGNNTILIQALSIGVGTMTYCLDDAGVIFELHLGENVVCSDQDTLIREDRTRNRYTARRWMLPCLEDINTMAAEAPWQPAVVLEKHVRMYKRRVAYPARERMVPKKFIRSDLMSIPNFSVSFRVKPYIATEEDRLKGNTYNFYGYIVTDIISPIEQTLVLTPALGQIKWYYEGRLVVKSGGWTLWGQEDHENPSIRLKQGANRLVGVMDGKNHFEDINLAGFTDQYVTVKNPFGKGGFQVVPVPAQQLQQNGNHCEIEWDKYLEVMPEMKEEHTMYYANAQDLAVGAKIEGVTEIGLNGEEIEIAGNKNNLVCRIILDLGLVYYGWLSFEVVAEEEGTLLFSFFEYMKDGKDPDIQWPSACNNALKYTMHKGYQKFESFMHYGARYIAVYYQGTGKIRLSSLALMTANCGGISKGTMLTSDPILNQIYMITQQTVVSSSDDTFVDCPTFEQVNWNFDNRLAAQAEYLTYGRYDIVRNSIKLFEEDSKYIGFVRSQYPSTWESLIPLYSFHWIMWCRDYYQYTGDKQFIREIFPRISAGIEEAAGKIGKYGLLEFENVWHFVEWAHGRDDDHLINTGEQIGFIGALKAAMQLAEEVMDFVPAHWYEIQKAVSDAINKFLWDEKRQFYVDSLHEDGALSTACTQVTNAMAAVYGIADAAKNSRILEHICRKDSELISFGSPYGLYYILELLDQHCCVEEIFRYIRQRWGEMVLAGDGTTWETFSEFSKGRFPTRSRCHGFSSYIIKYMVKYLMGIEILAPGLKKIRVSPNPPKGLKYFEGAVPCPDGLIKVKWCMAGDSMALDISCPEKVQLVK